RERARDDSGVRGAPQRADGRSWCAGRVLPRPHGCFQATPAGARGRVAPEDGDGENSAVRAPGAVAGGRPGVTARVRLGGGEVEYSVVRGTGGAVGLGRGSLVFLHEGLGSVSAWRDFPALVCSQAGRSGLVWSRYGYGGSGRSGGGTARYMHDE